MLIAHYVRVHRYRPPREFIEAVVALDGPGGLRWDDVRRVARRLWGNDDGLADARPGCT